MTDSAELIAIIEPIARRLLGEPNRKASTKTELRFGTRGSMSVDLVKGVWTDHEVGQGGGVLDLVARETGLHGEACFQWVVDEHFLPNGDGRKRDERQAGRGRIVNTYPYQDEGGQLLFEVVRFDPKDFRQRRPDATRPHGWDWSTRGVRQVPYRLPELLEALALGKTIYVVEGERDVDRLLALGVPATTNAGGAGKWSAALTEFFAGADVVIVPDIDPQKTHPKTGAPIFHPDGRPIFPGQDHGEAVAHALSGVAKVRLLDLSGVWPEIPPKGDVSTWLDSGGGSAEALYDLVDRLPLWSPGEKIDEPAGGAAKFKLTPFEDIKFVAAQEWRVKKLLPRQGVAPIFGPSQAFKSFICVDLALHVALGWEWAGRKVQQGSVVYIAAENGAGTRKRKVGFELAHAGSLPGRVPFYLVEAAPNLGTEKNDLGALIASVEAVAVSPAMIVVDTLAQTLGGGEENTSGMMIFLSNATALASRFKCCVAPVHHAPLADEKRMRGWSGLYAGVDALIRAERKGDDLVTALTLVKLKDDESGIELTVRLGRVVLGEDEDGDEISTLVVTGIEAGAPKQATPGKASSSIPRQRRLLMEVAEQAIEQAGQDLVSFPKGPTVRAVSEEAVRLRYYIRIAEQAERNEDAATIEARRRKAFGRALKAAIDAKDLMAREYNGERMLWLP
jgi:hypothetical protein